jgi:anti-sigma factor RsiW
MGGLLNREGFRRDHRWAPRRMSDYLDGELAPAGRTRMERHLGECPECRRLLAGLRRTLDGLHRLSAQTTGVDAVQLAASVRARLSDSD